MGRARNSIEKQKLLFELIEQLISEKAELAGTKKIDCAIEHLESDKTFDDLRTGAKITHVHTSLDGLINVAGLHNNFFQRKLQNHLKDKIYKNLIISILKGHLIPELRVAVLRDNAKVSRFSAKALVNGDYTVSIIDGLQRYACFLIALYLAAKGNTLVEQGVLRPAEFEEFSQLIGPTTFATVLNARIRLEVYYNIEIKDLLKYMIIFNTAQKRMSLNHQLEIMESTILQNLQNCHGATFIRDTDPGSKRNKFTGADLVMAIQAFLERDHTLSKTSTTDSLFWSIKEDEEVVDEKMEEICKGVAFVTKQMHSVVHDFYEDTDEPKYMNILPNSASTFVVPMMASLGTYVERMGNVALVNSSLKRIVTLFKQGEDVFQLDAYYEQLDDITTSRSSTIKNMAERAFRDFWYSRHSNQLDWSYARKAAD